jgi:hypothetical protein
LVIDARVSGKTFCQMTDEELTIATNQIILRCSAEVGCDLPFTETFSNILSEQIILFIKNCEYENYTLREILLSSQINMMYPLPSYLAVEIFEVTFSGRCINVSFISKILNNYKTIRNQLDRKLQNSIDGYNNH